MNTKDVLYELRTKDGFTEEQARAYMKQMLPKLDYWKSTRNSATAGSLKPSRSS